MPSPIEKLLSQVNDERIDLDLILNRFPWITETNKKCIISPDADGFLCGLFMNSFFNWEIVGFYDGKILLSKKNLTIKDCIFLDIEIFHPNIRSVGNHCIIPHNGIYKELGNDSFKQCISPGMLRGFDGSKYFRLKYPLGTIHFLISILYNLKKIIIQKEGISSLLFVDGVFNVLFSYPENVITWIKYLQMDNQKHPLNSLLFKGDINLFDIMQLMRDYFIERDKFGENIDSRGDRLNISDRDGNPKNLYIGKDGCYSIKNENKEKIIGFIKMNSEKCGWEYDPEAWTWSDLNLIKFKKEIIGGEGKKFNQTLLREMYSKKVISNAQTAGNRIEFSHTDSYEIFNSI